jgi:G patch domain-containing protein 1
MASIARVAALCMYVAVPLEFFAPVSSSIGVQLLLKMGWRQGKGIGSKAGTSTAAAAAGRTAAKQRRTGQGPSSRTALLDDIGLGGLADLAGFRGSSAAAAASDSDDAQEAAAAAAKSSKWGTVAGVSIENTPMYVLEPKQDLHGLGFDPFEGAEEFRSRKRQKLEAARAATGGLGRAGDAGFGGSSSGRGGGAGGAGSEQRGVAFGTGALEESDTLGYVEDYVDADADIMAHKGRRNEMFAFEEASGSGETGLLCWIPACLRLTGQQVPVDVDRCMSHCVTEVFCSSTHLWPVCWSVLVGKHVLHDWADMFLYPAVLCLQALPSRMPSCTMCC